MVTSLVEQMGADAIDAGALSLARYAEPVAMLLVQPAYTQGMGPNLDTRLLRG